MADPARRGPDPLALIGGLVALGIAASGIAGTPSTDGVDLRWVLALAAVAAGVVFLVASLRNSRRGSDD